MINTIESRVKEVERFLLKSKIKKAMDEYYDFIKGIETYKTLAQTDERFAELLKLYEEA